MLVLLYFVADLSFVKKLPPACQSAPVLCKQLQHVLKEQTCLKRCTFLNKTFLLIITDRDGLHGYLQEQLSCITMGKNQCLLALSSRPLLLSSLLLQTLWRHTGRKGLRALKWTGPDNPIMLPYWQQRWDLRGTERYRNKRKEPWSAAQAEYVHAMCILYDGAGIHNYQALRKSGRFVWEDEYQSRNL